jgi:hypothetical protein
MKVVDEENEGSSSIHASHAITYDVYQSFWKMQVRLKLSLVC